jgi:hypothetical protein
VPVSIAFLVCWMGSKDAMNTICDRKGERNDHGDVEPYTTAENDVAKTSD